MWLLAINHERQKACERGGVPDVLGGGVWDGAGHDKSLLDEEERTGGEKKKKHGGNPMGSSEGLV